MDFRLTANSFDFFDTLVTRRALRPQRIFEDVERALGAQGFTAARVAAEHSLMQGGRSFDLHDIYRELVARGKCTAEAAERLKAAEIDAEFDHAVPVVENLVRVREFDLVVSDMYLPTEILRRLLQHVGLRVFVHIFVSNAGKHFGTIWPVLNERWLIQRHLGDNPQADVASPGRHGIVAEHYVGTQPSQVELLLEKNQLAELAGIVRALRVRNPFAAGSPEFVLWTLYAQCNLPLLCLAANAVRQTQVGHGRHRVLFSARDGNFLSEIFSLLFPAVPTGYLHVSRQTLWNDRDNVNALLDVHGGDDALVVDIASSGHSWYRFTEATQRNVDFFALVRIDLHEPVLTTEAELAASRHLRFTSLLRNSELAAYSNAIEVLNTAPYGSTQTLARAGSWLVPVMAPGNEIPPHLMNALTAAHSAALDLVRHGRGRLHEEFPLQPPTALLQLLVQTLSVQPVLVELGKAFV